MGRGAVVAMTATLVFMFGILCVARTEIQVAAKPGTKDLALIARRDDPARRPRLPLSRTISRTSPTTRGALSGSWTTGTSWSSSSSIPAEPAARFIDDAEFRREWAGPGRVFAVARTRDAGDLLADPVLRFHVVATGEGHYLLSNQP